MKRAGWAAAFFILFPLAAAAEQSPVKAEARVWQAQATLGDEIRVSVQVEHPRDFSVIPPSPQTPLSPFEIKKIEFSPFRVGKNRVRETLDLTLTVFELGELKIPPIAVTAKSDTGRTVEVRTEPLAVKIVSVGKRVSDKDDIRPIKGRDRDGAHHRRDPG
ncbi:MAG: hypothetical protein HYZ52_01375 [Candidatus Omnitrophica bacterium]|nr:hypothetical protein [Candidatus Omnitrophota bacterium]